MKKIMSVILVLAVVICLFASCGKEQAVTLPADAITVRSDEGFDNAGFTRYLCKESGPYAFVNDSVKGTEWSVYVLNKKFDGEARYIPFEFKPVLEGEGTIDILSGQFIYIRCSVNSETSRSKDEKSTCSFFIDKEGLMKKNEYRLFIEENRDESWLSYCLWDANGDGKAEVIVKVGKSARETGYMLYDLSGDEVVSFGFGTGVGRLLGYGENALAIQTGQMGMETVTVYKYNGVGISEEVVYETYHSEGDGGYRDPVLLELYAPDDFSGAEWEANPQNDNISLWKK